MPYKNKEDRNARNREKYAQRKIESPEWRVKRTEQQVAYHRKKMQEDEAYRTKVQSTHDEWWEKIGRQKTRDRCGYISKEDYLAKCEAERKSRAEYMREWNKTEAGRRARVSRSIKKRCGLTIEEYDRIYDEQEGKCKICGVQRERYSINRLVVDHCHQSGKFRALLCGNCNCAIGLLGEDPQILLEAINYLHHVCGA